MSDLQTQDADVVNDAAMADALVKSHTDSDSDQQLYAAKVEALRVALSDCDADAAECQRNLDGWKLRLDATGTRRAQLVRQLQAARVAQRAMEDAADGI